MSPYEIEMFVCRYNEYNEPLYMVRIYSRNGKIIASGSDMSKEEAVRAIANYCCVVL